MLQQNSPEPSESTLSVAAPHRQSGGEFLSEHHNPNNHHSECVFITLHMHCAEPPPPQTTQSHAPSGGGGSSTEKRVSLTPSVSRPAEQSSIVFPAATAALSLIFPLIGCFGFCICHGAPKISRRYKWALRSLYTGCILSVAYALAICFVISHFHED